MSCCLYVWTEAASRSPSPQWLRAFWTEVGSEPAGTLELFAAWPLIPVVGEELVRVGHRAAVILPPRSHLHVDGAAERGTRGDASEADDARGAPPPRSPSSHPLSPGAANMSVPDEEEEDDDDYDRERGGDSNDDSFDGSGSSGSRRTTARAPAPDAYGGRSFDTSSPSRDSSDIETGSGTSTGTGTGTGIGGGGGTILSSLFGASVAARSPPEPLVEQWPWLEPVLRLIGAPVLDVVGLLRTINHELLAVYPAPCTLNPEP